MNFKTLLATALVAFSTLSVASVKMEMFEMNRNLGALMRADSAEKFQHNAEAFLVAAKNAQQTMPSSLDDDQEKFKGYQQGVQEVIEVVEQAKQLAAEGKLDEAKVSIEKLNELKKKYHSEYK